MIQFSPELRALEAEIGKGRNNPNQPASPMTMRRKGGSVAKKKSRKKPITPNSQITSVLRRLWMYSRERRERLRLDDSTCWSCKRKASKAKGKECKVEVHHIDPCQMDRIIAVIREELLIPPDGLATFCRECHKAEHKTTEPHSGFIPD